jgi:hypothetical protein
MSERTTHPCAWFAIFYRFPALGLLVLSACAWPATSPPGPPQPPAVAAPTASSLAGAAAGQAVSVLDLTAAQVPPSISASGQDAALSVGKFAGRDALRFAYTAARTQVAALVVHDLRLRPELAGLWIDIRVAQPTSLALLLTERDGSRYQAFFVLRGAQWYTIAMPLAELWLAEGTSDENGRLDIDQVSELRLIDLANLPGQVGLALGLKEGPQEMLLARLDFTAASLPGRSKTEAQRALVDSFQAEPLALLPIGGPRLASEPGSDHKLLRVDYQFGRYRWAGLVRGIAHLPVERLQGVAFRARAAPAVRLHVILEERDGSKYFATVLVPAGEQVRDIEMPLARFRLENGSQDENNQLDPEQLRVLIIVADTFTTNLSPGQEGSYWLADLALLLAAP